MKAFLPVAIFLLSASAMARTLPGTNLKIDESMLHFSHQPAESPSELTCRHTIKNPASQDWDVICRSEDGKQSRRYSVHLWVTAYPRETPAKVSYEVLYWVDDVSESMIRSHGSTIWFHLKERAGIERLELGQFVDGGLSSLDLAITVSE